MDIQRQLLAYLVSANEQNQEYQLLSAPDTIYTYIICQPTDVHISAPNM